MVFFPDAKVYNDYFLSSEEVKSSVKMRISKLGSYNLAVYFLFPAEMVKTTKGKACDKISSFKQMHFAHTDNSRLI